MMTLPVGMPSNHVPLIFRPSGKAKIALPENVEKYVQSLRSMKRLQWLPSQISINLMIFKFLCFIPESFSALSNNCLTFIGLSF